jgi:hypothetical protein
VVWCAGGCRLSCSNLRGTVSQRARNLGVSFEWQWSILTILRPSKQALCSHESQRETSIGGAVPHLWR